MKYTLSKAAEHIKRCNDAAKDNEDALFRCIFLASSSIRIHSKAFWSNIAPIAYRVYCENGRDIEVTSPKVKNFCALRNKSNCIKYAEENKTEIYHQFTTLSPEDFYRWMIKNVPGLGLAKAAFVSQLANGYLGCLDTVNLKRFGLNTKIRTINKYMEAFYATGETGCELWRNWCIAVSERDNFNVESLSVVHSLFIETGGYDPAELTK